MRPGDRRRAEGRQGFLSSSTTVDQAITNGTPIVKVGTPVFTEQLAVSVDKSGPTDADFMAALNQIIPTCTRTGR